MRRFFTILAFFTVVVNMACAMNAAEPALPDGVSLGRCLPPIVSSDDMDKEWYVVRCESGAVIFIPREVLDGPREPESKPRAPESNT